MSKFCNTIKINKELIGEKKINEIINDLTVAPTNSYITNNNNIPKIKIYRESKTNLYIPKYYGLQKFKNFNKNLPTGLESNMKFNKELNDYQIPCVTKIIDSCKSVGGGLLCVPCGYGKCLAKDTPIIMCDGSIKYVQDIEINDNIMGDDSNPRKILSTCTGFEQMYKIQQEICDEYIVNESHILTIENNNNIIDSSLKDCYNLQQNNQIYGCNSIIKFKKRKILIPINRYVKNHKNGIIDKMYKCNLIKIRIELVYEYIKQYAKNNIIIINCNHLKEDLLFIFRSCGLYPKRDENGINILNMKRSSKLLLETKINNFNKDQNNKFSQNTLNALKYFLKYNSFNKNMNKIKISKLGMNTYYGFEIDGNRRFLLGDCTITHNTVVSLYIACALKSKTLVVVHKDFLVSQWKERIKEFTDASIGTLQGKTIDVENKDIVIGMLQSISQLKYSQEILNQFNFVIYDECHHTSAESFSKALYLINSKYQLGLSATPTRKDGLTKVYKWFLGDILYQVNRKNTESLKVIRFLCKSDTSYYKECFNRLKKQCIPTMINNVVKYDDRNLFILQILKPLIKNGRDILILSERRNHLCDIQKLILEKLDIESGLYIGGMKAHDLNLSCEKQIILATYQMASEGFDCKKLNTLVMVTSKSDIVQSVGRILRKKHENIVPLIIDFCDIFSIFTNQAKKRLKFYQKSNYNVDSIDIMNFKQTSDEMDKINKCVSIKKLTNNSIKLCIENNKENDDQQKKECLIEDDSDDSS